MLKKELWSTEHNDRTVYVRTKRTVIPNESYQERVCQDQLHISTTSSIIGSRVCSRKHVLSLGLITSCHLHIMSVAHRPQLQAPASQMEIPRPEQP
jgi:hypothetical protein